MSDHLPHPSAVHHPYLDLTFRGESPDRVRAIAIELARMGRFDYPTIYAAVCRALGPGSPEAKAEPMLGVDVTADNAASILRTAMSALTCLRTAHECKPGDYDKGIVSACRMVEGDIDGAIKYFKERLEAAK